MSKFSDRLKELRQSQGYSQTEAGEKLGIKKTTLSNYETGYSTPNDEQVYIRMANVYNVTVDYLIGRTDTPNEHVEAIHPFASENIEYKNWAEVKEMLRKRLVASGQLKEGEPLPLSYLKRFIQIAIDVQSIADGFKE